MPKISSYYFTFRNSYLYDTFTLYSRYYVFWKENIHDNVQLHPVDDQWFLGYTEPDEAFCSLYFDNIISTHLVLINDTM